MKNIPVKIGWETIILIAVPLLFPLYFVFTDKDYIPLAILIPAIIFVSILIMGISYRIIETNLSSAIVSSEVPEYLFRILKALKRPKILFHLLRLQYSEESKSFIKTATSLFHQRILICSKMNY